MKFLLSHLLAAVLGAAVLIGAQWGELSPLTLRDSLLSVQAVPYLMALVIALGVVFSCAALLGKKWLWQLGAKLQLALFGLAAGVWVATIYESHQILPPGHGHWGLSNLYEVSVLLLALLAGISRWLAQQRVGVLLVAWPVLALNMALLFWLSHKGVAGPQALMPALQSYWLPWHVLANFVAYGCFFVAGAVGAAALIKPTWAAKNDAALLMDRSVALGFPLFTLAIILGALWASEAWGGYWSWDPKETWALMVWLVYAGYLHARHQPRFNLQRRAIWAVVGFWVTLICYLGVNLFMDGLHSYGKLPA